MRKKQISILRIICAIAIMTNLFASKLVTARARLPHLSNYDIVKALDSHDIANFLLTEDFLNKMEQIQAELIELPVEPENAIGDDLTVSGLTKAIKAHPTVMAILNRHDVPVRDYVLGSIALSDALSAAVSEEEGEEILFGESPPVSPQNMTFGKKYADRIRALRGG